MTNKHLAKSVKKKKMEAGISTKTVEYTWDI